MYVSHQNTLLSHSFSPLPPPPPSFSLCESSHVHPTDKTPLVLESPLPQRIRTFMEPVTISLEILGVLLQQTLSRCCSFPVLLPFSGRTCEKRRSTSIEKTTWVDPMLVGVTATSLYLHWIKGHNKSD
ncbi:hypothetical protein PDE_06503 [Penicillium oxalicum 114-2]|uniref:Uncharacterized protein n=1 Tax=Penicillium oxalicum (strain 114-2 / CGMCC 5302) TaxID=933388 RepID=S8AYQ9_PENO1|nr:hypothetical protein PDE_06503 [Penicillium oxalicum 114-2]